MRIVRLFQGRLFFVSLFLLLISYHTVRDFNNPASSETWNEVLTSKTDLFPSTRQITYLKIPENSVVSLIFTTEGDRDIRSTLSIRTLHGSQAEVIDTVQVHFGPTIPRYLVQEVVIHVELESQIYLALALGWGPVESIHIQFDVHHPSHLQQNRGTITLYKIMLFLSIIYARFEIADGIDSIREWYRNSRKLASNGDLISDGRSYNEKNVRYL